jgi:hypothetical protein
MRTFEWVQVRMTTDLKRAVELAAAQEGVSVSTWVRNQVVAGLYLAGVQAASRTIYQGIRQALKPELDEVMEVRTALDGLIAVLPDLVALSASSRNSEAIREAAAEVLKAALGEAFAVEREVDA